MSSKLSRADLESDIENLKAQLKASVLEAMRMGTALRGRDAELQELANRAYIAVQIPESEMTLAPEYQDRLHDLFDFIEGLCRTHGVMPKAGK